MAIIDTHAHIYGKSYPDILETVGRAKAVNVQYILLSNVDSTSLIDMDEARAEASDLFRLMIGLHPTSVEYGYERQLERLYIHLTADPSKYIAIGEIGLDYYWSQAYKSEMNKALRTQLEWAVKFDKPVSLHAREAITDTVQAIKDVGECDLRGVFHSFTGTAEELALILELSNFMIGINGVFTFKNSDLSTYLPKIAPVERLVVETDAPYLAPVPKRGKRNESSYLPYIIEKLADAYEIPIEAMEQQLYDNSMQMFFRSPNA